VLRSVHRDKKVVGVFCAFSCAASLSVHFGHMTLENGIKYGSLHLYGT
jgi:hypothetical protein